MKELEIIPTEYGKSVLTVPEDAEVRSADAEKFSVGLPADGKGYQNAVTYKVTTC